MNELQHKTALDSVELDAAIRDLYDALGLGEQYVPHEHPLTLIRYAAFWARKEHEAYRQCCARLTALLETFAHPQGG